MAKQTTKEKAVQSRSTNDREPGKGKGEPVRGKKSEANHFVSALAAEPNDATTRLVYADWLEKREELEAGSLQRWIAARISEGYEFFNSNNIAEEIKEYIIEEGEMVYELEWDSGGPGAGAGVNSVHHWKGKYVSSSDNGHEGPFNSLDEALEEDDGLLCVNSATGCINSSVMSAKEIAKRLVCYEKDGFEVQINGQYWVYRAATNDFKRPRSKEYRERERGEREWRAQVKREERKEEEKREKEREKERQKLERAERRKREQWEQWQESVRKQWDEWERVHPEEQEWREEWEKEQWEKLVRERLEQARQQNERKRVKKPEPWKKPLKWQEWRKKRKAEKGTLKAEKATS
jgi:uncharacterized protein (TIGR02996 family)